jgi:elongation factor 1-gamma
MTITIYSYPHNVNVNKALIAAQYGNVTDITVPDFAFTVENKTDEFKKLNPFGRVPVLKTSSGDSIFESNAIVRYIAAIGSDADGLLGKTPLERAHVDQWIDVSSEAGGSAFPLWLFKVGFGQYNEDTFNQNRDKLKRVFDAIELHLNNTGNKFLTGERVRLSDITVISVLANPIRFGALDAEFRKPYPKTEEYLRRVLAEKQVHAVLGDVAFVEKFQA